MSVNEQGSAHLVFTPHSDPEKTAVKAPAGFLAVGGQQRPLLSALPQLNGQSMSLIRIKGRLSLIFPKDEEKKSIRQIRANILRSDLVRQFFIPANITGNETGKLGPMKFTSQVKAFRSFT